MILCRVTYLDFICFIHYTVCSVMLADEIAGSIDKAQLSKKI